MPMTSRRIMKRFVDHLYSFVAPLAVTAFGNEASGPAAMLNSKLSKSQLAKVEETFSVVEQSVLPELDHYSMGFLSTCRTS